MVVSSRIFLYRTKDSLAVPGRSNEVVLWLFGLQFSNSETFYVCGSAVYTGTFSVCVAIYRSNCCPFTLVIVEFYLLTCPCELWRPFSVCSGRK